MLLPIRVAQRGTRGMTGPWHTPVFHGDVWVNPGICVSILLLLFPCGCSELNGLNYGANYLKVNASTVMMEVFVVFFLNIPQAVQGERERPLGPD